MLFCKANAVEWKRVLRILGTYEVGSGQKVNLSKTSLFFSRNTSMERRAEISKLSGLVESIRLDTYLGLLAGIGKSKVKASNNIKEKVGKKLSNWRYKFLSQAGKEVLLKAVIQAIPTYCMSVFMLPASLCKDLNRLMQSFWWKFMANFSGIHQMSWEKMSRSKKIGGLGFRDLNCFNKALLVKQGWRLCHNPSSLMGRILKAKCLPNKSFLKASLGKRPSYAWRSIFMA